MIAELGLHVVDEGVGEYLSALDDHLVGVGVAVVARLGEYVEGLGLEGEAVFLRDDFIHHAVARLRDGVQKGLGHAVADGGVQALAFDGDRLEIGGHLTEVLGLFADEMGLYVLLDDGDEVLCKEEGIASAAAGILHCGAVARRDLTVLEDEHDGDGLAGLTDGGEAGGLGLAEVGGAVGARARLYGALIVKVEACAARGADYVDDFHGLFIAFQFIDF